MTLTRLSHAIVLAFGWRRAAIAFAAGALSALALAPFNAWPILFVTFPVLVWLVDGSAAGRWSGAVAAAGAGWCFGFGYFRRRTLLGRLRLSGRCQDLRLAAAGGGRRLAGLSRALHRVRACRGAADLGARTGARAGAGRHADHRGMAARPSAQRLSLEHFRLCADPAAGAGAKRVAGRHLGPHLSLHRDLCEPGRARRRQRRYAASLPRAADRPRHPRGVRRLRRGKAMDASDHLCERREAAHHAAQSAAGREIQLRRQGRR